MKENTAPTTGASDCNYEFFVAGVKFHKFNTVKDILEEGMAVDLIPEPTNKYDRFAIKIKHNNVMLGYVPKKLSAEVTEVMNSGTELAATIIQLQPDFEPWTALKVGVRGVTETPSIIMHGRTREVQDA